MNQTVVLKLVQLTCLIFAIIGWPRSLPGQSELSEPIRRTLVFQGTQREYFVRVPPSFDRNKSYWPLVVVHGAEGEGRFFFLFTGIARVVADLGFEAIVISPSFPNDDNNVSRFPVLGEGAFLEEVLRDLRKAFSLKPKMLLTGYSRGGQFAHRFALANAEQVAAVAPLAAGTWTTPDGRLLVGELGEVRDARSFLSNPANASQVPERFRDLFDERVAAVAELKAVTRSREIPFLVMCGTLDPRLPQAKEFVRTLEDLGYQVEVEWPRTPHACDTMACRREYGSERQKYSSRVVQFFQRITREH